MYHIIVVIYLVIVQKIKIKIKSKKTKRKIKLRKIDKKKRKEKLNIRVQAYYDISLDFIKLFKVLTIQQIDDTVYKLKPRLFWKVCKLLLTSINCT